MADTWKQRRQHHNQPDIETPLGLSYLAKRLPWAYAIGRLYHQHHGRPAHLMLWPAHDVTLARQLAFTLYRHRQALNQQGQPRLALSLSFMLKHQKDGSCLMARLSLPDDQHDNWRLAVNSASPGDEEVNHHLQMAHEADECWWLCYHGITLSEHTLCTEPDQAITGWTLPTKWPIRLGWKRPGHRPVKIHTATWQPSKSGITLPMQPWPPLQSHPTAIAHTLNKLTKHHQPTRLIWHDTQITTPSLPITDHEPLSNNPWQQPMPFKVDVLHIPSNHGWQGLVDDNTATYQALNHGSCAPWSRQMTNDPYLRSLAWPWQRAGHHFHHSRHHRDPALLTYLDAAAWPMWLVQEQITNIHQLCNDSAGSEIFLKRKLEAILTWQYLSDAERQCLETWPLSKDHHTWLQYMTANHALSQAIDHTLEEA